MANGSKLLVHDGGDHLDLPALEQLERRSHVRAPHLGHVVSARPVRVTRTSGSTTVLRLSENLVVRLRNRFAFVET